MRSLGELTVETVESPGAVIRVFGGAGLEVDGEPVSVGGPRQRRLLALLTIRAGEVVDIDWLAEYLWSDRDRPDEAVASLRTSVSRLRSSFPERIRDWIETEPAGYRLTAPDIATEHRRFAALRSRARRARESGDPAAAEQLLEQALELWRGEPFRELEDLDWAQAEVARLRLDRLEALEERWETALALGRHTQITGELAAFTAEHALRERAVRQYALALHRSGRSTEALRVIEDHRRRVGEVSGLEPSAELTALEDGILEGDPALGSPGEGRPLRGYRLLEQVGAGAFSIVWRGIQPSVDRPVAIKQIRAELAAQPEFIRRFEIEAQTVARIEHPHIVPLIDFWRDPDAAYLVMRWLPGGTLERRLDDGPLDVHEAIELVEHVGRALAEAHRHDVIHRDVKSANVMFDELGNAFLTDFGIALAAAESAGPEAQLSVGSPAYASPEQLRREHLTPASDVFSLGVVLYECLAGSTPFSDSSDAVELVARQFEETPHRLRERRADVPEHIDTAVMRALAKDPVDRFASVLEFLEAIGSTISPAEARRDEPSSTIAWNPYLGLRAFEQTDTRRFFGRRRLVTEMIERMSAADVSSHALMVVGPSGSGKSSVVRAGLLPAVTAGEVAGSDEWFVTTMVPGRDPFESLEAALLRIAVNPPVSLLHQLRDGRRGILRGVRRCVPGDDDTVLVVVDQFEELFVGRASMVAKEFLDAMATALDDPGSSLRFVGTLRADFYHRPLEHQKFAPILKRGSVDVTPLAPDELEEAIVRPAELAGVSFEPGLVALIAAEAGGQPSPLPLLQYLLAELFERRSGSMLTIEAYDELGGLAGALAERAEEIYESADTEQRGAIRRVFGRLTDPGESSADLRRRVLKADLGDGHAVRWVLDRFGSARLLTFDRDPATREPTVEVAHEALLREWPRLVRWLDEDRDLLSALDTLSTASAVWDDSDQDADLLRGPRLAQALDVLTTAPERLRPLDRAFIDASQSLADREREAERRRARRLRRLNTAVSVALVLALIAGLVAFAQRQDAVTARIDAERAAQQAEVARAEAELGELMSASAALVDDRPDLGVLLALEAHRRAPGPNTERAVLNAMASAPGRITEIELPVPEEPCAEVYRDRLTVSANGYTGFRELDGRLVTVDLRTGEVTDRGPSPAPCVLWLGDEEQNVRWVTRTQRERGGSSYGIESTTVWRGLWEGPLVEVDLPRLGAVLDGGLGENRMLFSGSIFDIVLLDPSSGRTVARIPELSPLGEGVLAIADDGRRVVHAADSGLRPNPGRVLIVDGRSGEELHRVTLDETPTAVSIDDGVVLAGLPFGRVIAISLESGQVLADVSTTSTSEILAVGTRDDGRVVAVAQDRVEVLDLDTEDVVSSLPIDARRAVVQQDGTAVVFAVDGRTAWLVEFGAPAVADQVIFESSSAVVGFGAGRAAIVRASGSVDLIDLDSRIGSMIDPESAIPGFETIVAFPTAEGFVAFGTEGVVGQFQDGEVVHRYRLTDRFDRQMSFAPPEFEGTDAAYGPADASSGAFVSFIRPDPGTNQARPFYIIDWAAGILRVEKVDASFPAVSAVAFDDGMVSAVSRDGRVRTYDVDGRWMAEIHTGVRDPLVVARSDRPSIAVSGLGGVAIVDPLDESSLIRIEGLKTVAGMSFVDDDRLLVTLGGDGTVRLWDAATGASAGTFVEGAGSGSTPPSTPWVDPESGTVWVASSGRLLEFSLDPERWIEKACEFVGRDLTQDEWDRYVPGDGPLKSACS